jgi:hypothetical protein
MIWLLIVIPVGLLIVFGVLYDYFVNKSFKEVKGPGVSQNVENAKRDAHTVNSNSFNGFGN